MPKSPSAVNNEGFKSPKAKTLTKNPSLSSNNVFGGGGDMFSFDSASLSKHTLRQEPKKISNKTKSAPSSTTAALRRQPEAVYGAQGGDLTLEDPSKQLSSSSHQMALTIPSNQRPGALLSGKKDSFNASPLMSRSSGLNRNTSEGEDGMTSKQPSDTTSALQSFLQTPHNTNNKKKAVDKSGFFTNFALMEELRTSEQAVEYFLKRQSHKFPVKFLHLIPKEPGHSGFYPYDLEVVSQEFAEAADRHYVMTESGMTAFARVEVEDPSLLVIPTQDSNPNEQQLSSNALTLAANNPPPVSPPSPSHNQGLVSPLSADGEGVFDLATQQLPTQALTTTIGGGGHKQTLKSSNKGGNEGLVGNGKPKFIVTETMSLGHWVSERNNYRVISQRYI